MIHYAGMVSRLAKSAEVEFVHMVEAPEIPSSVKDKYPWLMDPLDDMLLKKMERDVRSSWEGHEGTELKFTVQKGENMVMTILSGILEQESDLVIVGRESFSGDLAVRLARKASCSVMSIPAGFKEELGRIIVPTDFSEYSSQALDVGLAFGEAAGLAFIESVHVYNIGKYSHRITLPQEEVKELARMYAEEKHEEYVETVDSRGINVKMTNEFHPVTSNGILRAARDLKGDLIVTGCRGRDTVTSWLLGGNAEYLLKNSVVPVVAVKPKGTGQKLLEALLQE